MISQPPSAETREVVSIIAEDMEVKEEETAVPISFDRVKSEQNEVSHFISFIRHSSHFTIIKKHLNALCMMEIPRKCTHVKVFSCVLFTPTCFRHSCDPCSGWLLTRIQLL